MAQILTITLPIYCVIIIGFAVVRFGLFQRGDVRVLSGFVLYVCLPALIFRAFSQQRLSELIDPHYLILYSLVSLAVFAFFFLLSRYGRGQGVTLSAYQALGTSACNSGYIGYPMAAAAMGAPAVAALAMNMVVENVIIFPLFMALAETGRGQSKSFVGEVGVSLKKLVMNPMMLSIIAGMAFALTGLTLPAPLFRTVDMLASASGPMALLVIGGNLVGFRIGGMAGDMVLVLVGKLLIFPAAVFAGQQLMPGLTPELAKTMLIFASVPMISIYPLLGQTYNLADRGSAVLVLATGLSFFTITTVLLLI